MSSKEIFKEILRRLSEVWTHWDKDQTRFPSYFEGGKNKDFWNVEIYEVIQGGSSDAPCLRLDTEDTTSDISIWF